MIPITTLRLVSGSLQTLRLAGRCADGAERDGGTRYHAVIHGYQAAICGARPGRRSAGWSTHEGEAVTCPRCLLALIRAGVLEQPE